MIRFNSSNDFINALTLLVDKAADRKRKQDDYIINSMDSTFKLGQVDPNYVSGRPQIIFEGEDAPSLKAYPYLASYTPKASDIVLLARVGNSYIVLGKRV